MAEPKQEPAPTVKVTNIEGRSLVEPNGNGTAFYSRALEYKIQFKDKLIQFQSYSLDQKRIGSKYITEDAEEIKFLNSVAAKDGHVLLERPRLSLAE